MFVLFFVLRKLNGYFVVNLRWLNLDLVGNERVFFNFVKGGKEFMFNSRISKLDYIF